MAWPAGLPPLSEPYQGALRLGTPPLDFSTRLTIFYHGDPPGRALTAERIHGPAGRTNPAEFTTDTVCALQPPQGNRNHDAGSAPARDLLALTYRAAVVLPACITWTRL